MQCTQKILLCQKPSIEYHQTACTISSSGPEGRPCVAHVLSLHTTFLQVAIHELSKALPEEQRPLPMECVAVNDNASFWLPNSGGTAGSTAAEGSCEAVRLACKELVRIPVSS